MRLPQDRILHISAELENGKVNVVTEWQGELVRCKNCKYRDIDGEVTRYYWCRIHERPVDGMYYCSWGEENEVEE